MALLLAALAGCTGVVPADSGPACDSGINVTWNNFGEGFFTTYCQSCHSSTTPDRRDAPKRANFDTEAQVGSYVDEVRARVLEDETMPVGGGVDPDDLVLLDRYLDCAF